MALTIWQIDAASLTPYYNLAICEALAEAGQHVHYVTSNYLYDQNLPFSNLYTKEYAYFRGLDRQWLLRHSQLRKLLRGLSYPLDHRLVLKKLDQQHPDIVHLQWSRLPKFDLHFIRQIKKLGIPVVHTIHNVKSSFASEKSIVQLGDVYAQADKLLLHAEANRRDFLALYPHLAKEKTAILPHVNIHAEYPQTSVNKSDLRQVFKLPTDSFVILFFGIIRQYKGLGLLLEAFQKAHQANPNIRLLIAGKAERHQDLLDVERSRQTDGVLVDERFIPSEDIWKYFFVADVAVLPYRAITQSGALIQALSFAKPVIVTDVGAFPESVDSNGWIVPRDDAVALEGAIVEAYQSRHELEDKSQRSLELIRTRHDRQAIASKLIQIYQSLL